MKSFTILLFLSFTCLISAELLIVAEFFRHGAREPVYELYDYKSYPSQGELTSVGMRQHYNLGSVLRHEYIDKVKLLSPQFDSSEIYISSTNLNRTIISALSQLYGLYPLGTGPQLTKLDSEELYNPPFDIQDSFEYNNSNYEEALPGLFQPIPIHNTGIEDLILRPYDKRVCSLNEEWQNEQYNSEFYKSLSIELNSTFESVRQMMNYSNETEIDLKKVASIYDVFQNDIWAGKTLPEAFQGDLKRNMTFTYDFIYFYVSFGSERQQLTLTGGLFNELRDYFRGKLSGNEKKKWLMYSAHDTTLIMLLSTLNLSNYQCILQKWRNKYLTEDSNCFPLPDYASNLLMELHRNEQNITVKFRYNGKYIKEYDYYEFEKILNKSIDAMTKDIEFRKICKKDYVETVTTEIITEKSNYEALILLIGVILGIIISVIFCIVRAKIIDTRLRFLNYSLKNQTDLDNI